MRKLNSILNRLILFGTKIKIFVKLIFLGIAHPQVLLKILKSINIRRFFYYLQTYNNIELIQIITDNIKLKINPPWGIGTYPKKEMLNKINKQGIICLRPFYAMNFSSNGNIWGCICSSWPKYSIGNIKHNSIIELWNSDTAQWIRHKMYKGEWQDICKSTCPTIIDYLRSNKFIKYEELEKDELLSLQLIKEIKLRKVYLESPPTYLQPDTSSICNLNCIMCNREQCRDDLTTQKELWAAFEYYLPTAKVIFLSGWGDPFARPDTNKLLINYKGPAKFYILTNGLLLPKYWEQIKHQKFVSLSISIDAATKKTYEKIRRGGKWEDLLKTFDLVKRNRDKFEYPPMINMTVMRSNYREIPQFFDLAESYGFNCFFQSLCGKFGDENIFELKDTTALNELRNMVINETSKKRSIDIRWGNLLAHLNIPFNINLHSISI